MSNRRKPRLDPLERAKIARAHICQECGAKPIVSRTGDGIAKLHEEWCVSGAAAPRVEVAKRLPTSPTADPS